MRKAKILANKTDTTLTCSINCRRKLIYVLENDQDQQTGVIVLAGDDDRVKCKERSDNSEVYFFITNTHNPTPKSTPPAHYKNYVIFTSDKFQTNFRQGRSKRLIRK